MRFTWKLVAPVMLVAALAASCGGAENDESTDTDALISEDEDQGWSGGSGVVTCWSDWSCSGSEGCSEEEISCSEEICCDDGSCSAGESACFDPSQVPGPGTRPVTR